MATIFKDRYLSENNNKYIELLGFSGNVHHTSAKKGNENILSFIVEDVGAEMSV